MLLTSCRMTSKIAQHYFCLIVNLCLVSISTESLENSKQELDCTTPNCESGRCIAIKECDVFLNQLKNKDAWAFFRSSKCGPTNEDDNNPKVCCGTDYNFKNIGTNDHVLPTACGREKKFLVSRIVGGKETSREQFPWMAILIHKKGLRPATSGCSGFLIHTKFIITAAHCINPPYTDDAGPLDSILFGVHGVKEAMDCYGREQFCSSDIQYHTALNEITHPEYDKKYNDIALIELKKTVCLSDYIQPICLAKEDSGSPTGYVVCGWGETENGKRSNVKRHLQIPPFSRRQCREKFSTTNMMIRDTQICAGGEDLKDSCRGDSGGPLMTMNDNGTWYATGVISFGVGCGRRGWPGLYTNIAKFLPWIELEINTH